MTGAAQSPAVLLEKFLFQEFFEAGVVLAPRRQCHHATEATRVPAEVAWVVLADEFYHLAHDGVFHVAIRPGIDLDQFAQAGAAVIVPAAEQEGALARALAGDLEDPASPAAAARLGQAALDVG